MEEQADDRLLVIAEGEQRRRVFDRIHADRVRFRVAERQPRARIDAHPRGYAFSELPCAQQSGPGRKSSEKIWMTSKATVS